MYVLSSNWTRTLDPNGWFSLLDLFFSFFMLCCTPVPKLLFSLLRLPHIPSSSVAILPHSLPSREGGGRTLVSELSSKFDSVQESSSPSASDSEVSSVTVVVDREVGAEEKMDVDGGILGSWPPRPSYEILVRLTCSSLAFV